MSARDAREDILKAVQMGADDYITKPVDLPEFVEKIDYLVRQVATPISSNARAVDLKATVLNAPFAFKLAVKGISENGVVLESGVKPQLNYFLHLKFEDGDAGPQLGRVQSRVLDVQSVGEGQYQFIATFIGLKQKQKEGIRAYLNSASGADQSQRGENKGYAA